MILADTIFWNISELTYLKQVSDPELVHHRKNLVILKAFNLLRLIFTIFRMPGFNRYKYFVSSSDLTSLYGGTWVRTLLLSRLKGVSGNWSKILLESFMMTSTEMEYPGKERGVDCKILEGERSLLKSRIMLYLEWNKNSAHDKVRLQRVLCDPKLLRVTLGTKIFFNLLPFVWLFGLQCQGSLFQ